MYCTLNTQRQHFLQPKQFFYCYLLLSLVAKFKYFLSIYAFQQKLTFVNIPPNCWKYGKAFIYYFNAIALLALWFYHNNSKWLSIRPYLCTVMYIGYSTAAILRGMWLSIRPYCKVSVYNVNYSYTEEKCCIYLRIIEAGGWLSSCVLYCPPTHLGV